MHRSTVKTQQNLILAHGSLPAPPPDPPMIPVGDGDPSLLDLDGEDHRRDPAELEVPLDGEGGLVVEELVEGTLLPEDDLAPFACSSFSGLKGEPPGRAGRGVRGGFPPVPSWDQSGFSTFISFRSPYRLPGGFRQGKGRAAPQPSLAEEAFSLILSGLSRVVLARCRALARRSGLPVDAGPVAGSIPAPPSPPRRTARTRCSRPRGGTPGSGRG